MAKEDRIKWDAKYRAGEYQSRTHPSVFVSRHLDSVPVEGLRALDIACGRGRNSRYLAELGYRVDGLDISPVGLDLARAAGPERINYLQCDVLEGGLGDREPYDVIIMIRFVALDLLKDIASYLVPGGKLLVENHMRVAEDSAEVGGPRSERFRVAPDELQQVLAGELRIEKSFQGLIQDPDGSTMSVAQIVARKQ